MLEGRLKKLREEKLMSLADVARLVGKSPSTISRYENNLVDRLDFELLENIAEVLDSSVAYLLGMTDDKHYVSEVKTAKYYSNQPELTDVIANNEYELPEIPNGSCVQIRKLKNKEGIKEGGYYYIQFNGKKVFRLVVDSEENGVSFLPMNIKEQRIAYDKDYVKVIGKAVSMKVFFE